MFLPCLPLLLPLPLQEVSQSVEEFCFWPNCSCLIVLLFASVVVFWERRGKRQDVCCCCGDRSGVAPLLRVQRLLSRSAFRRLIMMSESGCRSAERSIIARPIVHPWWCSMILLMTDTGIFLLSWQLACFSVKHISHIWRQKKEKRLIGSSRLFFFWTHGSIMSLIFWPPAV